VAFIAFLITAETAERRHFNTTVNLLCLPLKVDEIVACYKRIS